MLNIEKWIDKVSKYNTKFAVDKETRKPMSCYVDSANKNCYRCLFNFDSHDFRTCNDKRFEWLVGKVMPSKKAINKNEADFLNLLHPDGRIIYFDGITTYTPPHGNGIHINRFNLHFKGLENGVSYKVSELLEVVEDK